MKLARYLAAAAALVLVGGTAWSAELPKIRLGWVVAPGSTAALLMMKPDASVHRGVTYTFEPMHFVSTAVELVPLASDQVDIIDISYPRSARRSRTRIWTICASSPMKSRTASTATRTAAASS